MTSAVMVGLLTDGAKGCPNLVNVLSLAKESGITVNIQRYSIQRPLSDKIDHQ